MLGPFPRGEDAPPNRPSISCWEQDIVLLSLTISYRDKSLDLLCAEVRVLRYLHGFPPHLGAKCVQLRVEGRLQMEANHVFQSHLFFRTIATECPIPGLKIFFGELKFQGDLHSFSK